MRFVIGSKGVAEAPLLFLQQKLAVGVDGGADGQCLTQATRSLTHS
jgi:hypothetical protein